MRTFIIKGFDQYDREVSIVVNAVDRSMADRLSGFIRETCRVGGALIGGSMIEEVPELLPVGTRHLTVVKNDE